MDNPSYTWRPVTESDLSALDSLDIACAQIDGLASVPAWPYRTLLASPGTVLHCAMPTDGIALVAVGWVHTIGSETRIGGKVHPDHRRRKLGSQIIQWAEAQAASPTTLIIRHEAFNTGSAALYAQHGYTCDFVENWMIRDLREPIPTIARSFTSVKWSAATARQFFDVYHDAFKERPGFPNWSADHWIASNVEDEDFRPDLSLLAVENGVAVGFVTMDVAHIPALDQTVGWTSQIGVRPAWRGRGIAAGLLTMVMETLKAEGLNTISLHVNVNNPGAIKVYTQLGFKPIGQRAKYSKAVLP